MKLLHDLNDEQKRAVMHRGGPLLIVAGAGTGKTTVITRKIAYLITEQNIASDAILALTFTDKAAQEMSERVDQLLPYGYVDLWIYTFHAFCSRILESYGIEIGIPHNFTLLDQTQQWVMIYNHFDRFRLDYYRPMGNPTKFLHALLRHFSRLKDEAISPEEYLQYAQELELNSDSAQFLSQILNPEDRKHLTKKEIRQLARQEILKIRELAEAYHTYQQILYENNALDFGDLITLCLKLLKERPKVLLQLRRKFASILVDEFQDTNWAQYELVKMLAHPQNHLTVAGDDDQSIYKFRGASVSNILQFKKDFPNAESIFLIKNYRSKQNILDLSYRFIQNNNPNRLEIVLGGERTFSKKLIAQRKGKGIIEYVELETQEDEVRFVIQTILELREKNHDLSWSDFAILVRANSYADLFNYGLSQAQIPYYFVASRGLYNKPVVLDILAWLRLLDNYHESSALYRILNLPVFEFTQSEISQLNYWARRKGYSLFFVLSHAAVFDGVSEETVRKAQKVISLIERHAIFAKSAGVQEVVLKFLEESGYLTFLTQEESRKTQETIHFLNQLYKKIVQFETSALEPTVKKFIELIDLEIRSGEQGALTAEPEEIGPEAVRVMTVHSAKGLEFRYVFIVHLVERRFPATERKETLEIPDALVKEILPTGDIHLQEERRLFYVACTRAKDGLWLTAARDYGGARKKKPSMFLYELGIQPTKPAKTLPAISLHQLPSQKETSEIHYTPHRFSFSQLKAYENCPWQYRYAFVLRVPVRGKYVLSFGKTIHAVLQRFIERILHYRNSQQTNLFGAEEDSGEKKTVEDIVSLDEVLNMYEEIFIDDWYLSREQRDEYFKKGKTILKNIYKEVSKKELFPKYLEKNFTIKIRDDKTGKEYSLYGVIDRVDEIDGKLEIIDYKTGEERKQLNAEDKEQLLIYQLAGREIFDKPISRLTFHYVENNSRQSFIGTQKDLERIQKKILKVIHEIEEGKFKPTPGRVCRTCDFREICPYRAE